MCCLLSCAALLVISSYGVATPINCIECHQAQVANWQLSDHAKAMAIATDDTVLADFNGSTFEHFSQSARFYTKDNSYFIEYTQGKLTQHYQVQFTFGHFPLQQYLIRIEKGRVQLFPFAWDSRSKQEGGQRWFANYATEDIYSNDRLHWLQPMQNWNGMCADCHSSGLKRNYNATQNSFSSQWNEINVGCQSCHQKVTPEHSQSASETAQNNNQAEPLAHQVQQGYWQRQGDAKTASWHGPARDNEFMDTCYSCHSLREPLTDGFTPGKAFLDQFSPTLLAQPLYHADGQIKEEVYVYGSFKQSKMHQAGVNCLDCHDAHTMKVKAQGNALCLQCHSSQDYHQPEHLNHDVDSPGGLCVNCHMPTTRYMGVDDRRDHSFKIPSPALTIEYGTPNACEQCHTDVPSEWLAEQVVKLWGGQNNATESQQAYIALQTHSQLPIERHLMLANDKQLSEIKRASAIALLPNSTQQLDNKTIQEWVTSPLPLVRLATAKIGFLLPIKERQKSYSSLLTDQYKAIRVAAVQHMIALEDDTNLAFKRAFKELLEMNKTNLWRGEGGLNTSLIHLKLNQVPQAVKALKHAINVDPYFDASYINLAEIYRSNNDIDSEHSIFMQGIKANPNSAILNYSFALALVRNAQKPLALSYFSKAKTLAPDNIQFAYAFWLALDEQGKTAQALTELKSEIQHYRNNPQLIELGMYFAQKVQDANSFRYLRNLRIQAN
nr:hypothetical protein BCU55_12355 [Shewanella sp. 10N.286.48.A6]